MAKKSSRNTKARIVSAAWKLFYEQGYEETTVEEIIFESETSKGSFYHYFDGKDALLSSLSMQSISSWGCCISSSYRSSNSTERDESSASLPSK